MNLPGSSCPASEAAHRLKRLPTHALTDRARIPLRGGGTLVPITDAHREDRPLIELLAHWRDTHADAFPTQFPVTLEGTARWLSAAILDNPDRILFLVAGADGQPIGHVGLGELTHDPRQAEAENIVRGVEEQAPGIMTSSMRALHEWAGAHCVERLSLRVFRDNVRAVSFYTRLGYQAETSIPLRRRVQGATVSFSPVGESDATPPDRWFLCMSTILDEGIGLRGATADVTPRGG